MSAFLSLTLWKLGCATPAEDAQVVEGRGNDGPAVGDGGDGGGGRPDPDPSGGGTGAGSSGSDYSCYDFGFIDCFYYYGADPYYWGCDSYADSSDYWEGYCDCEFYYGETYECYYYSY